MRNVFFFVAFITLCFFSCTNELQNSDLIANDEFKVKGELIVEIQEDWIDGELIVLGYKSFLLEEENNELYPLQMTNKTAFENIENSGSKVEILGKMTKDDMLSISQFKVIHKVDLDEVKTRAGKGGNDGGSSMLVVMVSDTASSPDCTRGKIEEDIVGANNEASVANIYTASSKGKFTISNVSFADAFIEDVICSPAALHNILAPQLRGNGVEPDNFDYVMYVSQDACRYGGSANLNRSQFHNDLCTWNVVTPHELGHALGMNHAAIGLNPDAFNDAEAYGDRSDFMGVVYEELNAPHRISMGWQPNKSRKSVRGGGNFTIAPLTASPKNTPQVLEILDTYYVSYRASEGVFDSDMNTNFADKVHIHAWNGDRRSWTRYLVGLSVGESYTLPEGQVVTFTDFLNGEALISIQ